VFVGPIRRGTIVGIVVPESRGMCVYGHADFDVLDTEDKHHIVSNALLSAWDGK
jgi:hypothetical protein